MDRALFSLADIPVTLEMSLLAGSGLLLLILLVLFLVTARRRRNEAEAADRQLAELMRIQSEMTGRMQTMAEIFGSRTADLARLVNDRLDREGRRMGDTLRETSKSTEESLAKLNERLAVIDRAQSTIASLSGEIVSLQSILADKQTRGAFGQGRMEAIVGDALPPSAYALQARLSNGSRPDCLVHMPNGAPGLVIDAKFPLEGWQRFNASSDAEIQRQAQTSFRADMGVHIKAIAEKYLIPGETQDTAFLFVPSESIFADLHERFPDVVQRAARARVVIVSPALLMLSIQVVQALLRDVRMREEAHRIQTEVRELLADLSRLGERTAKLKGHFGQAVDDLESIGVSMAKLSRRGERIEAMEFDDPQRRLPGVD